MASARAHTVAAAQQCATDHRAVQDRVQKLRDALGETGIAFDDRAHVFRHKGRVVPGLTKSLRTTLWPSYKYKKVNSAATRHFRKRDTSLRSTSAGRARGTRVHEQLEALTNFGGSGALQRKRQKIHPFAAKLLAAFARWGWRPVASEIALFDPTIGIATAADLVCSGPGGKLILVEVKNGYYGSWERGGQQMEGPLRGVLSDTPRAQALVQLLMTRRMMELHGARVDAAYVVRADCNGVTTEKAFADLDRRSPLVAAYIGQRLRELRAKRRGSARRAIAL